MPGRPDVPFLETADLGLWVNEDHTFVMAYDADGGPTGYGRLTGTVIRTSDGLTIAQQLDIPLMYVVGAELNSFGFYAMDVFPGRETVAHSVPVAFIQFVKHRIVAR